MQAIALNGRNILGFSSRTEFGSKRPRVRIPTLRPYQGTNFDRKTAFHFGGLFFYLWPERLEIAAFSGGFTFLRNMAVVSKTGLLFTKSIKVVAVSFDLNTFITSACSRNTR